MGYYYVVTIIILCSSCATEQTTLKFVCSVQYTIKGGMIPFHEIFLTLFSMYRLLNLSLYGTYNSKLHKLSFTHNYTVA